MLQFPDGQDPPPSPLREILDALVAEDEDEQIVADLRAYLPTRPTPRRLSDQVLVGGREVAVAFWLPSSIDASGVPAPSRTDFSWMYRDPAGSRRWPPCNRRR